MNEIEELFPFYALDALSEEEKAQIENYVQKDNSARARLEEMLAASRAIPFGVTPILPSKEVKQSLMARVNADAAPTTHPVPARPVLSPLQEWLRAVWQRLNSPILTGFALATIAFMVVWVVNLQKTVTSLSAENQTLQTDLQTLSDENQVLQQKLLSQNEMIALLTGPERREIPIAGTDQQPDALATLLVGGANQGDAILIASNLPQLPPGSIYEFWLIGSQGPVPSGLFQVDEKGQGILFVHSQVPVFSYDAVGVSIEPERGSEQPTGDIVLLGELVEGESDS